MFLYKIVFILLRFISWNFTIDSRVVCRIQDVLRRKTSTNNQIFYNRNHAQVPNFVLKKRTRPIFSRKIYSKWRVFRRSYISKPTISVSLFFFFFLILYQSQWSFFSSSIPIKYSSWMIFYETYHDRSNHEDERPHNRNDLFFFCLTSDLHESSLFFWFLFLKIIDN